MRIGACKSYVVPNFPSLGKHHGYTETPLSDQRLFDAVNMLLLMQNGIL